MTHKENEKERLIIAIDFGTTFSGVAYCFASQSGKKVGIVTEWSKSEAAPKIPTLIDYHEDEHSFDWGSAVKPLSTSSIPRVKLMLDPSQEHSPSKSSQNIQDSIAKLPKPPIDVAADFIGALYKHALGQIAKEVPEKYFSMCEKEFVLTVPAVWSDKAKNDTVQAAKKAGIHPVTLIKEPEAAALWTMHSIGFSLQTGDAFVVCDAGGGTVDLISYEITSRHPRLELHELVPGTGGMAGSMRLNQRFLEAVETLVGANQYKLICNSKSLVLAEKMFDREIKKAFGGTREEEYYVNFPMADLENNIAQGLKRDTWRMRGDNLLEIFEPVVAQVLQLVNEQVKAVNAKKPEKKITGIFLVGGFGGSQYLKSCIEEQHPDIQVLQPSDAWAAIAKGAVLTRLETEARVMSKKATKHYGVRINGIIDPLLDRGQPTSMTLDGYTRCSQMRWYIKKGDAIHCGQKIRFPFFREFKHRVDPDVLSFIDELVECSDEEAPRHPSNGQRMGVNCTVKVDMHNIDRRLIHKKRSWEDKPYYKIYYDLVITMETATMKFSTEIDGKEMGSVEVNYE